MSAARRYRIEGRVQGVGFRWSTMHRARELGMAGWVRNLPDGSVEAAAAGDAHDLRAFEDFLRRGPPASTVTRVLAEDLPEHEAAGLPREFQVVR